MTLVLSGPLIYSEHGMMKNAELIIEGSKIKKIVQENYSHEKKIIFPENYHIVPGFIDVHIHGAKGSDVMDGTEFALKTISEQLAVSGTTAFLATTMTAPAHHMSKMLRNIGDFMQKQHEITGARVLGVHLEGPFISEKKMGAQRANDILMPNIELVKKWQRESGQVIKLVTLAPELMKSEPFIHYLISEKIIASIGHTDATYAETCAAIQAGCSHITHLFNAMRGIHQREPGTVTAALLSKEVSTELIADGIHLHPAIIQLALKMKGKEKIILVTDAIRAQCLSDGVYELGGQLVSVQQGKASLCDGTLAGSTITLLSAIKNMLQFTDCDLHEVVRFASENPAKMLGIFQNKGSIAAGKDADIVVLDEQLNVVMTLREGKVVYQNFVHIGSSCL